MWLRLRLFEMILSLIGTLFCTNRSDGSMLSSCFARLNWGYMQGKFTATQDENFHFRCCQYVPVWQWIRFSSQSLHVLVIWMSFLCSYCLTSSTHFFLVVLKIFFSPFLSSMSFSLDFIVHTFSCYAHVFIAFHDCLRILLACVRFATICAVM